MDDLKKDVKGFIRSRLFLWPLFISSFLVYAFTIIYPSISIDDTAISRYLFEGELIAQGRFGMVITAIVFQFRTFTPIVIDAIAVLIFVLASILWCVVIKRASSDKLHQYTYTVFAIALVTYPLINEIFIYFGMSLYISVSYLLTAAALLLLQKYFKRKQLSTFFWMVLIIAFIVSCYESFAQVFLAGVLIILILERLNKIHDTNQRIFIKMFDSLTILVIGILVKYLISAVLLMALHLKSSTNGATGILWLNASIFETLKYFIYSTVLNYGLAAFYYFPITVFVVTSIIGFGLFLRYSIKQHSSILIGLFSILFISLFALGILQGTSTPYRAAQVFAIFVAFILLMSTQFVLSEMKAEWLKTLVLVLISLLLLQQAFDLNKWFYVDKMRSDEETRILSAACLYVESNYGFDKPIVFTGKVELSDNINQYIYLHKDSFGGLVYEKLRETLKYQSEQNDIDDSQYWFKYTQTLGNSTINWAIHAFNEPNTELINYAHMIGFDIKQGNETMYTQALRLSMQMPEWPAAGSVSEEDTFILVHF